LKVLYYFLSITIILVFLNCSESSTESDSTLKNSCQQLLTSPSSTSIWVTGEYRDIIWNSSGICGTDVTLDLYKGSNRRCNIEFQISEDSIYNWYVGDCGGGTDSDYRIKFTNSNTGDAIFSDSFTIIVDNPCQISFNSPTSVWYTNEVRDITWDTTGHCGTNVKIELFKGTSKLCNIIDSTTHTGTYSWSVSDCGGGSDDDYRIKITDLTSGVSAFSNNFIIIVDNGCFLRITHPYESSVWSNGSQLVIVWETFGFCGNNVMFELYRGSVKLCDITFIFSNLWIVDNCNGGSGDDYRIKITDIDSGYFGFSNYFTIN